MEILDRSTYVGPSHYAHFPVIRLELDLELHQEIVCYCATIHAQGVQTDTRVGLHRFQHVTRLISNRLQRRAYNVVCP